MQDLARLLDLMELAAREASAAILEVYASDFEVVSKTDASPVTRADSAAEAIILRHIAAATPDIPVIAEEQSAAGGVPVAAPDLYWLVDPLDGTKEFIKRNGEFTVNIALIDHGRPVLGVVGLPAKGIYYTGRGPGTARKIEADGSSRSISVRPCPDEGATVAYSRSHADMATLDAFFAGRKIADRVVAGSSLKFCLIAEGEADLYPRFGPTMEWDTAAAQAVLEAAGGQVEHLDGNRFDYAKPGFRNPGFIARGQ